MPFKGIFFHTFLIPNPRKGSFSRELFFQGIFSYSVIQFYTLPVRSHIYLLVENRPKLTRTGQL